MRVVERMTTRAGTAGLCTSSAAIGAVCLVVLLPLTAHAQVARTGLVTGQVTDPDGLALPGATVMLSSPSQIGGDQTATSGANGEFRFPALEPGLYSVAVSMDGFNSEQQTDVRVRSGLASNVGFSLTLGVTDTVTVRGAAPQVDIRSSASAETHMDAEFFQALPTNRSLENLINLVPGAVGRAVSGGTQNGTQWNVDGTNQNDPEGGEGDISVDFDNIAEVSFSGVGGEAQIGGYSGIVVSAITKSGSNNVHGAANFFYRGDGFNSQNSDNPEFRREVNNNRSWHVDIGGPLARDKLWGYGSFRRNVFNERAELAGDLAGFSRDNEAFGKLTWQLSPSDKLQSSLVWQKDDSQDASDRFVAPEATFGPFEKRLTFNLDYLHVFSPNTYLDAKVGLRDSQGGDFKNSGGLPAAHFDIATERLTGSPGWFFDKTRNRYQGNVALTHFADDFLGGSHDFKAGISGDVAYPFTTQGLTGSPPAYYVDYDGQPLYRYDFQSTAIDPKGTTVAFFVQDSWTLNNGRLTINPGLRLSHWFGKNKGFVGPCCGEPGFDVTGSDYAPAWGVSPRLGLVYDLLGDGTTAVKAHYGRYYEQLIAGMYGAFSSFPGIQFRFSFWDPEANDWVVAFEERSEGGTPIDPNVKMPNFTEFSVGIERQLTQDFSVEVTGIVRETNSFMDQVRLNGVWVPVEVFDAAGNSFTVYDILNADDGVFIQTNPTTLPDLLPPTEGDPFAQSRKYWAIEVSMEKRFSNRWQLLGSYVYSQARGTDDTDFSEGEGRGSSLGFSSLWTDPNTRFGGYGPMSHDVPHQIKLSGSVVLPYEILFGAFYNGLSGRAYTKTVSFRGDFESDNRTRATWASGTKVRQSSSCSSQRETSGRGSAATASGSGSSAGSGRAAMTTFATPSNRSSAASTHELPRPTRDSTRYLAGGGPIEVAFGWCSDGPIASTRIFRTRRLSGTTSCLAWNRSWRSTATPETCGYGSREGRHGHIESPAGSAPEPGRTTFCA